MPPVLPPTLRPECCFRRSALLLGEERHRVVMGYPDETGLFHGTGLADPRHVDRNHDRDSRIAADAGRIDSEYDRLDPGRHLHGADRGAGIDDDVGGIFARILDQIAGAAGPERELRADEAHARPVGLRVELPPRRVEGLDAPLREMMGLGPGDHAHPPGRLVAWHQVRPKPAPGQGGRRGRRRADRQAVAFLERASFEAAELPPTCVERLPRYGGRSIPPWIAR